MMAKSPEKKPDPSKSPALHMLPMELRIGDRLVDETGEWEVAARPYTTAGGKTRAFASSESASPPSLIYGPGARTSASR